MNTKFAQIIDFYKGKQLPITAAVGIFLLFLSALWHPFIYVFMVFLLVSMIFSSVHDILCLSFLLLPFSGFLIVFIGSSIFMFVIISVKYIIAVVKKQEKFYKLPLIISLSIIAVFSSIFYGTTDYGAMQGVLIICIFLFIYLVFAFKREISAVDCLRYLLYGLIASALMGLLLYYIPNTKMFSFKDWGYGLVDIKSRIFDNDGSYNRLALLCFHENHLYALCIFGIAYVAYYFLSREKKTVFDVIINLIGLAVSVTIGVLTLSKAFMILLLAAVVLVLVLAVVVYKKHSLKVILPVIVIGASLILIFKDEFLKVFERFFSYNYNSGGDLNEVINKITTGRFEIWNGFIKVTFSTPLKALFGVGIFSADVVDIGPHNLYVAIIYRFGILGIICLLVLTWSYIHCLDEKLHFSVLGLLPLLLFLLLALQEACLDERLYFLVISLMLLFSNKNSGVSKIQTDENSIGTVKVSKKGGK